ncbi:UDP-N-acetyl-D-glucosamine dehydrogenase [Pilimelia terevasa]|uniref:UDP-N-acetyl-D-glucosamine dehydrogenase n=1 Tax=Pilimelia terevasa TaxID=53372 RepID=A0A8J3FEE0_9ACTN|nr:nucleotide sugar dehydrogenase [Pilimelia terevasa]GGK16416.1 UDP-N-acetyl-D-glucosamine dehydrogenase [Pilimelia terevasa]
MTVDLAVVGLGYVGLSLAHAAVAAGLTVAGVDTDPVVVSELGAGRSRADDMSAAEVGRMFSHGFRATTHPAVLGEAAAVAICVPTPLDGDGAPDLAAVRAAATTVGAHIRPDTLVLLESTVCPGTTEEVVLPILERSGLRAGTDVFLAFSPERVDPGNRRFHTKNTPKIIGGYTGRCTELAAAFYGRIVDSVVKTRGTREAEMAKLLENTYRQVNIALVNELSRFCHALDIDVWDVVSAAGTKPFGFQPFRPGVGVGGHCIPVDPSYLGHGVRTKLGMPFRFVELANEINGDMPRYVAQRAQNILNDDGLAINGAEVLLLGIAYKPDVSDHRETPAAPLARHLRDLGARLTYHDPLVEEWSVPSVDLRRATDLYAAAAAADLVVLLQPHRSYDTDALVQTSKRLFDTCGATAGDSNHRL